MTQQNKKDPIEDRKAERKSVGEWLSLPYQWRIPVYQRHYSWRVDMESGPVQLFWKTVKEQTLARLECEKEDEKPSPHYLGAVLVENKTKLSASDGIMRYDVVDGQQRLTTIQIALLALIHVSDEYGCAAEIKKAMSKYVFVDHAKDKSTDPRLRLTNLDNKQFKMAVYKAYDILADGGAENTPQDNSNKSKIVSTFHFLAKEQQDLIKTQQDENQQDPKVTIRAIAESLLKGLDIVRIVLLKSDESQKVFESLNNYSERLTTFDLIRNNVFYRADKQRAGLDEELFDKDNWQELERPYWEETAEQRTHHTPHIEAYIARMLVAKMKREISFSTSAIFATYQDFHKECSSIEEEIRSLASYTKVYKHLDSPSEYKNPIPGVDFGVFKYTIWSNRDFYPVLFRIADSNISDTEKQKMVSLMESYVIRRSVCRLSPEYYNRYAPRICRELGDNDISYKKLRELLISGDADSVVFPKDKQIMDDSARKPFYRSVFQYYVFRKIEESLQNDFSEGMRWNDKMSIDHILPKKWYEKEGWRKALLSGDGGSNEEKMMVIDSNIDVIGNLTIMSGKRNSAKSNNSWEKAKELLLDSPLELNNDLGEEDGWNANKIVKRGKFLAEKICKIWPDDIV